MFTLFPYLCTGFFLGFTTRSVGLSTLIFCCAHFLILRPLLGTGLVTEIEYDVFYTMAYIMHAIVGFTLAWGLNVPPLVMGTRRQNRPCTAHTSTANRALANAIPLYLYRGVLGFVVFALIVGGTMAFEFIPLFLAWLGIIVAFVVIALAIVIFFFAFRKAGFPRQLKLRQAIYLMADQACFHCCTDMTLDILLYMLIYYVVATAVFCAMFVALPWWWQFYTALILFVAFEILFIVGGFSWMRRAARRAAARKKAKRDVTLDTTEEARVEEVPAEGDPADN
jgi:hypothetical protein